MQRLVIAWVATALALGGCSSTATPGPTQAQRTAARALIALTPAVNQAAGASTRYLRDCVGKGQAPTRCVAGADPVLRRDDRVATDIARRTAALATVVEDDDRWRDCLAGARAVPPALSEFDRRLVAYRALLVRQGSDPDLGPALVRADERPYRLWQIAGTRCTEALG